MEVLATQTINGFVIFMQQNIIYRLILKNPHLATDNNT